MALKLPLKLNIHFHIQCLCTKLKYNEIFIVSNNIKQMSNFVFSQNNEINYGMNESNMKKFPQFEYNLKKAWSRKKHCHK